VKIKLPFKSSPQAIRADPPCRTRQRTKPTPDEKKKKNKHLPIDKFDRSIYLFITDQKVIYVFTTPVTRSNNLFSWIL
jgi:hypothetical protein